MVCSVCFPSGWVTASVMEHALSAGPPPHLSATCIFKFESGCKIMIDAAVRLLSLFNQLDHCCRRVLLDFEDGESGTMGYLNRMGFFDHLSRNITIKPGWPLYSGAEIHGGTNARLVEIARINHQLRDSTLPSRLTSALMQACGSRPDAKALEGAAWTIFAELIDNIFSHSQTPLDGYAALQNYSRGQSLMVAVSDSGLGIMETLRPALCQESPTLFRLTDLKLLVEIFRQGISRHGLDRGCGLKGSAAKAMKYNADLDIRLPQIRVLLTPRQGNYQPSTNCYDNLPLIWGTHICFNFKLDS
jgi:hypothetical protein